MTTSVLSFPGVDFGTAGRLEIHIVDGPWYGKRNVSLCGLVLTRRLENVSGRERRVCQDCNERWMS